MAGNFLARHEAEHNLLFGICSAIRGHGYATSLTAAASADQLARGRRFCFLFTDLANPTSNAIYRSIGYEPVCDMDQYRFDR